MVSLTKTPLNTLLLLSLIVFIRSNYQVCITTADETDANSNSRVDLIYFENLFAYKCSLTSIGRNQEKCCTATMFYARLQPFPQTLNITLYGTDGWGIRFIKIQNLSNTTQAITLSSYTNTGIPPDNYTNIQRINKMFRKRIGITYVYEQIWFDTNSKYSCTNADVVVSLEYGVGEVKCYDYITK